MEKEAFYKLTYGLFVVTAREGEKDNGCIINTAQQVTSTPTRIVMALNQSGYTHDMIKRSGLFNLSVLSEEAKFDLFQRFGYASGRETDKFAGFPACERGENGLYFITDGANAHISGKVIESVDVGTHTLFIADVTDAQVCADTPSVTYGYYLSNIKPKPREKPAERTGKVIWRCKVCGYEYEGEELPDDFICPICKHSKDDFEKIIL